MWWLTKEHFPQPMSRLMFSLLPAATDGWMQGATRLGLPDGPARWGSVHGWVYYAPGAADPTSYPDLERAAAETLSTRRWRSDARDWFERRRAEVVDVNRARQAAELGPLDDRALADRIADDLDHFRRVAPIHFEHSLLQLTMGWLAEAADGWGLDPGRLVDALQGASTASTAAHGHVTQIAAALDATGVGPEEVRSIDDVRAAGPAAAAALDRYLEEHGWRLLNGNELAEPTLVERPAVIVASLRAVLEHRRADGDTTDDERGRSAGEAAVAELRAAVPAAERARFDELLADARDSYRLGDDDGGICWTWPLGLLRRSVLEAGRRLHERGRIDAVDDLFEADPAEVDRLLPRRRGRPAERERAGHRARPDERAPRSPIPPGSSRGTAPPNPDPVPLPEATAELAARSRRTSRSPGGAHRRGPGPPTCRASASARGLRPVRRSCSLPTPTSARSSPATSSWPSRRRRR